MSKVKIITDSTCDLPEEIIRDFEIMVIPLKVIMDDEIFTSGIDLTSETFYKEMPNLKDTPSTNPPSPILFYSAYEDAMDKADSIISIHISKKMSETYNNALQAKSMLPSKDIRLFDSRTTGASLGLVVYLAAKAAKEGKNLEQIITIVENSINDVRVIGIPSTLKYLIKGGRIGKARGLVGRLLGTIPILTVSEGETASLATMQGQEKAMNWMINYLEKDNLNSNSLIALTHGNFEKTANIFLEKITKNFNCKPLYRSLVGPVVGSHLGPGSLFFSYLIKN